jgi:hypothetical protein
LKSVQNTCHEGFSDCPAGQAQLKQIQSIRFAQAGSPNKIQTFTGVWPNILEPVLLVHQKILGVSKVCARTKTIALMGEGV